MKPTQLLSEGRKRATEILHQCVTPHGFRASGLAAGYPQIWSRDCIVTFLGAAATGDATLIGAGRASLETMGAYQSNRGLIQLNVNPDTGHVSTENAGAADANLWFILGHFLHFKLTGDTAFLAEHWAKLDRALIWLEFQDMNECGLLEIPEAGDWMDLMSVRYNVLYDNVLYYAALLAHQEMAAALPQLPEQIHLPDIDAFGVHERLNLLMWIDRCWVADHFAEHLEKLKAIRLEWFMVYHNMGTISSRPFYMPWVAFREYGDWCDSLGNLLAVLTGIADGHRTEHILRYLSQVGMAEPYPTKAIYPPIFPGENGLAGLFPQPQPQPAPSISQRRHLAHDRRLSRGRPGPPRLAERGGQVAARPGQRQPPGHRRAVGVQRVDARAQRPPYGLWPPGLVRGHVPLCRPRRPHGQTPPLRRPAGRQTSRRRGRGGE